MNNSAVNFPLVPLQKQIETAPHPEASSRCKDFQFTSTTLIHETSILGKSQQTGKRMERLPTQACN